jgi:hypothetical protein
MSKCVFLLRLGMTSKKQASHEEQKKQGSVVAASLL